MSAVRSMMARFYQNHGLADPEKGQPVMLPVAPLRRGAPRQISNADNPQQQELGQLRQEIDDYRRSSGQQLETFRADLEKHFGTLETVQASRLKAQEDRLSRERSRLTKKIHAMELEVIAQEAILTNARKQVLKTIEQRLPRVQRGFEAAPPERIYREQDTQLTGTGRVSQMQHDKALALLSWLEGNRMPEDTWCNGETLNQHLHQCPLLTQTPYAQFCELVCLLKTLPNHLWRNHVTALAHLMG